MTHQVGVGAATLAASLATIGIGLLVYRLAPRVPANSAFAIAVSALGLSRLGSAFVLLLDLEGLADRGVAVVAFATAGVYAAAAFWFASVFPVRRGLALRPWGRTVVIAGAFAVSTATVLSVGALGGAGIASLVSALVGAGVAFIFAGDARKSPPVPSAPVLVVAFAAYSATTGAGLTATWLLGFGTLSAWLVPGFVIGLAVAVLAALRTRRWAVVLAVLAFAAAGASNGAGGLGERGAWPLAVARLALPLLVAYALVRHQLFDFDLRVKWTLRRGTLAAFFIAAFLGATEVAQSFLTDEYGYLAGAVAAGVLVFGLAPLQRVAERVADTAMPGVREPVRRGDERDAAAYRGAVEMALQDGVVSRQEEKALARLADRLGIPAERALQIREDVERERGVAPA